MSNKVGPDISQTQSILSSSYQILLYPGGHGQPLLCCCVVCKVHILTWAASPLHYTWAIKQVKLPSHPTIFLSFIEKELSLSLSIFISSSPSVSGFSCLSFISLTKEILIASTSFLFKCQVNIKESDKKNCKLLRFEAKLVSCMSDLWGMIHIYEKKLE